MRNRKKPDHQNKKRGEKKLLPFPDKSEQGKPGRGEPEKQAKRPAGEGVLSRLPKPNRDAVEKQVKHLAKEGVFSRILVPAAFLAIVVYLIFAAWEGIRDPYTFVMAYEGTIENGMHATGWVVREEIPIETGDGTVQLQLTEGGKIGKGQPIATVYQNEDYRQNQKEMDQVRVNLTSLQYATYDGSPTGSSLEEQLLSSMKTLRMAGSSGSTTDISERADTFRKLVLRREFLVSSDAADEMGQAAYDLNAKLVQLQKAQTGSTVILAPKSGVFYTDLDGYETLLTPDGLKGIMPDDLRGYTALTAETSENSIGRLVSSWRWYYAILVTDEEAEDFSGGDKVYVQFDSLSESVPMTVNTVSENQNGYAVVVLRSAENLDKVKDLRREDGQIIFRSDSGIIIPKGALHILEDGSTVVYTVSGYLALVKPVKVLGEGESGYAVEPVGSDGTEILRPGDEVIIASADLYDGKVVR